MNILIVSQYFWPEEFRINDLALDLHTRGHEVTVLTGNPNYPKGKFYKGYGFKFTNENYHGIKIYRVPVIPRGNNSIKLIANYISFVITGSVFALFHQKKYDKIFAVNYSPITAVYPAIVYKKCHHTRLYLWVQDLWPESVSAAGNVKSNLMQRLLIKLVKNIYRNSDKVLVQSEAFIESVEGRGVTKNQLGYIPNWAEDLYSDNSKVSITKFQNIIPIGFKVMFAGNIGEAQDFESIILCAQRTKVYPEIKWIIIGDGRKKSWVENQINCLGLQETVFLMGRYPMDDMPSFFVHADVMLMSLKDEKIFSMTIPGKIQSYMAFGKPIVGMLNGIGAEVIRKANCGYVVNAGDFESLANNVVSAYKQDSIVLLKKGLNGKEYYKRNFSKRVIIDNLIDVFNES
jgi:glycosyltransferase involved in cell wall biosynthesis